MTEQQRDPATIMSDIEETRHEFADTAAALAEKADVKGRAQERVDEAKEATREKVEDAREKVGGAAASAVETTRTHPKAIAILIAGLVVGYLVASRRR